MSTARPAQGREPIRGEVLSNLDGDLGALVEAIAEVTARRVLDLLTESGPWGSAQPSEAPALVDAAEAARLLDVTRDFVYEHAEDFGVVRLGDGERPRLRFDRARLLAAATVRSPSGPSEPPERRAATPKSRPRRQATTGTGAPLLPIRGQDGAC